MIIRYAKDAADAHTAGNTFEAFDEIENKLGSASVDSAYRPLVTSARPGLYTIRASGQPEAMDALLGAATAHALRLARESRTPGCIRMALKPGDETYSQTLKSLGYTGVSELRRMRSSLGGGPITAPIPEGLTVVRDYLNDERERRFFLERQNAVFDEKRNGDWLQELRKRPFFTRLLLVDKDGLAGEMITWAEGMTGVVESIYVHPDWRGRGAGRFLMEFSRIYWLECRLRDARFDIWSRLESAISLAYASRFRPEEVVETYPYMDVNA